MYKHARIYKLAENEIYTLGNVPALQDKLAAFAFTPCADMQAQSLGFVAALPHCGPDLLYPLHQCLFFAVKMQWRDIPASALKDEMQPLIDAKAQELGRTLSKREKSEIQEAVLQKLLPRALCKSKTLQGYIDVREQRVVLNLSSSGDAETVLSLIRKAFESLPALPFLDGHKLAICLNSWANNQNLPAGIVRGHDGSFKAQDDCRAVSSFKNHVFDERVTNHLEDKMCYKLQLYWPDRLAFNIDQSGLLSKLDWDKAYHSKNDEMGWDDIPARVAADTLLLVSALRELSGLIDSGVTSAPLAEPQNTLSRHLLEAARNYVQQQGSVTADQLASRFDLAEADAKVLGTALALQNQAAVSTNSSGQFIYTALAAAPVLDHERDDMYEEAKRHVISTRRASVSGIQRHLRIGYNHAARIMEQLEANGVVTEPYHNGQREVLAPLKLDDGGCL